MEFVAKATGLVKGSDKGTDSTKATSIVSSPDGTGSRRDKIVGWSDREDGDSIGRRRMDDEDDDDDFESLVDEEDGVGWADESAVNPALNDVSADDVVFVRRGGPAPPTPSSAGSAKISSPSSKNSKSSRSVTLAELAVGPPRAGGVTFMQHMFGKNGDDDTNDDSVSSFDQPAVILTGGSVGPKPNSLPGQTRRRRAGMAGKSSVPPPQFMKLDNTYVMDRARQFIKVCRKPFLYRRARDSDEHSQAWQEIREDLDSIKKDDFMATFILRFQDEESSTALHHVCRGRPPIYIVEAMLGVSGRPVKHRDRDGNLPLHLAAQYGASCEVVQTVLQAYPDGADMKNEAGRLPVLLALIANAQPRIVEVLKLHTAHSQQTEIDEYMKKWSSFQTFIHHRFKFSRTPSFWMGLQAALVKLMNCYEYPQMAEWIIEHVDDDEDTPVHFACGLCPPVDMVKLMIETSRAPFRMQNAWGGLPLHYAVLRGAPESITILLCQEFPEAIRVRDDFGSVPLHYALRNGATFAVIEALLDEYPEACGLKDNNGYLPLHVAAITGVKDQILKSIVDRYPKATRSRDNNGSLPVHHAVKRYSSRQVIEILEKVDPVEEETSRRAREFLEQCDVYGIVHPKAMRRSTTVGHERLQGGIWAKVRDEIESLSQDSFLAEEVASHSDEYGNTPLHVVCMSRPPVDVVKSLIKMSTTPLSNMKNEHEWIPLHCAIRYGASYDVVKVLLDASPESSKVQNEHGKLPFQMAVELNASAEVKKLLFDADKTTSKEIEDCSRRALEFRRVCTIARHEDKQHSRDYDPNQAWQAVRDEIVKLKQEASIAKRVAEYPDRDTGMTALHIICGSTDPPPDVVELLIGLSREPLRMKSKRERLPLHIALDNGASDDVLKLLLKAHPEDTKKEDLHDGCLFSLKSAVMSGASVEVIKLLTDASPVPVSDEGIAFLESLEVFHPQILGSRRRRGSSSILSGSRNSKDSVSEFQEELMDPAKRKVGVSEEKMDVLIHSFLDEYQGRGFCGSARDEEMSDTDEEELSVVGRIVSFPREVLIGETDPEHERYLLVDRFFSFLRKMPTNLKDEALFHPSLHDMLNKMISRRSFGCVLMADFFFLIAIIVTLHHAVIPRWNEESVTSKTTTAEFVVLVLCISYLILRELVQVLSYHADGILNLWYKDLWNWLDVSFISLLLGSTVVLNSENGLLSSAEETLVLVTGGLSWIMLLVQLKSTTLEFSVFTSGLINIARKLVPFLITSIILLEAFAFMFFVDSQSSDDQDCPPTEMVGLESGGHEEVEVDVPNFCTFSDTQLKVFTMVVSIQPEDFTGGSSGKVWLAVIFAFLFVVILLNVLIAIVNDNWEDVQRDGVTVFWQARYSFVNEVDALGAWTASLVGGMKGLTRGKLRERWIFFRWYRAWLTLRSFFWGTLSWIGYVLWLLLGLVSLGFFWDDSIREWLLCRKPAVETPNFTNEMLRDEFEASHKDMAAKMDDMKKEMDSLKKQLIMLLQEQRAQQAAVTGSIGSLKRELGAMNRRVSGHSEEPEEGSVDSFITARPSLKRARPSFT